MHKTRIQDGVDEGGIRERKGVRASTAKVWLRRLGLDWKQIRMGVYVDSRERSDVLIERTFWVC